MIECPWCGESVRLHNDICPECKHEVLPRHLSPEDGDSNHELPDNDYPREELSYLEQLEGAYCCAKCGGEECRANEVAMTGTGISKLLDIQHHHYLFVSCLQCGSVEIYDSSVLQGKKAGVAGSALDLLF